MIFGDVDTCFAEQRSNAPDNPRNVIVGKNKKRVTGLDVDVERANPGHSRRGSWLRRSRDRDFLHTTAESNFNRIRILLGWGLSRREIYPAGLSNSTGIDEIEPFLLHRAFEKAARRR